MNRRGLRKLLPRGPAPAGRRLSRPSGPAPPPNKTAKDDDLFNLDIEQLSKVPVVTPGTTNANAPSGQVNAGSLDSMDATTTGEMAREAPSVSTRRTSAINLDPQVRGYRSGELNATANGMNQVKTRVDIDSALSQIDPGVVDNITVIDGPYTSLYGPGFAFLAVDLLPRWPMPMAPNSTT